MKERRSIRVKIKREELHGLLGLPDDIQIVQITVGNDGEISFLLEGQKLPVISRRGSVPDFEFSSISKWTNFDNITWV